MRQDVTHLNNKNFTIVGCGEHAVKISLESEQSKREYLAFTAQSVYRNSVDAYTQIGGNETMAIIKLRLPRPAAVETSIC